MMIRLVILNYTSYFCNVLLNQWYAKNMTDSNLTLNSKIQFSVTLFCFLSHEFIEGITYSDILNMEGVFNGSDLLESLNKISRQLSFLQIGQSMFFYAGTEGVDREFSKGVIVRTH